MDIVKWDHRFLRLAREVSTWSKDPSTKVGSVIACGKLFIAPGFNGFPSNIEDKEEWLNNREEKYSRMVHAEDNALTFAYPLLLCGNEYTQYVYPFMPCEQCAEKIRKEECITKVVSMYSDVERWQDSFNKSKKIFEDSKIELVLYEKLIEVV